MSRTDGSVPRSWVLVDERPGTAAQSLAVADALAIPFDRKPIRFAKTATLPNVLLGATSAGVDRVSRDGLVPPWPDLVIAAGRRSAPVARWIKRMADRPVFIAQIMFPGRVGVEEFDLIAVPRHDLHATRPNQIFMTGAPHQMTISVLEAAAGDWRSRFGKVARPWFGLLVGGATRRQIFEVYTATELGRLAGEMTRRAGGSLFVTTSRRTGDLSDAVLAGISESGIRPAMFHRWNDEGGNPYRGILALADGLIVTGDSVSMCTEACAATAPLFIYAPSGLVTAKHVRFHEELYSAGYAKPFTGEFAHGQRHGLNAADDIAREIKRRLAF